MTQRNVQITHTSTVLPLIEASGPLLVKGGHKGRGGGGGGSIRGNTVYLNYISKVHEDCAFGAVIIGSLIAMQLQNNLGWK